MESVCVCVGGVVAWEGGSSPTTAAADQSIFNRLPSVFSARRPVRCPLKCPLKLHVQAKASVTYVDEVLVISVTKWGRGACTIRPTCKWSH